MDGNTKVPVKSRTEGSVAYKLDSMRVSRSWPKTGSVLQISLDELKELMVQPGGEYILRNLVIIENEEARLDILGGDVQPEYNYTEKEIQYLLYEAEDNALLDCLDYAPIGVLELIKQYSLEKLPNTTAKTKAVNQRLGIDLNKIAELISEKDEGNAEKNADTGRRTAPLTVSETKQEKYKVVGKPQ